MSLSTLQRDSFSSHMSCRHGLSDSEPTEPLSVDGNCSELEDEDEEEGGRVEGVGEVEVSHLVPQTPDQEAFLKEHFVTLADLSASGTAGDQSED